MNIRGLDPRASKNIKQIKDGKDWFQQNRLEELPDIGFHYCWIDPIVSTSYNKFGFKKTSDPDGGFFDYIQEQDW